MEGNVRKNAYNLLITALFVDANRIYTYEPKIIWHQPPFMALSFMALLVIPHLKLSNLGLFDGDQFRFV